MEKRPLPEDFREFINFLNKNEVQYLLVGGWAVGLYGNPRAIKKSSGRLQDLADVEKLQEHGTRE